MRKIIVASFITMDGVLQAPGAPEEDSSNGFRWGGWQPPYWDDKMGDILKNVMSKPFDLLLGRRTYEIFAAHWPYQNDEISEIFNRINKYVVATTPIDLSWNNSILIDKDVVNQLNNLKNQEGPDLLVHGSGILVQTLFSHQLVDVLHTWFFPITLGQGKKLFADGTQPRQWKLTESMVSDTGAIFASYIPDGDVKRGSFVSTEPSEAELLRRVKLSRE